MRCFLYCALAAAAAVLGAQPSANEQLTIYELNRARANPQRYAQEHGLGNLLATIAPAQPLAVNNLLVQSAQFKSAEMAQGNYVGHQSAATGKWPNDIVRETGYPLNAGFHASMNECESIAGGHGNLLIALRDLIHDEGINPPYHQEHLLSAGPSFAWWDLHREIGVGYAYNVDADYRRYYAIHTAFRVTSKPFLTGVAFNDANGNQRMDPGEAIAGATVSATNGTSNLQVTTNAGGGWAIEVDAGNWTVNCTGGAFAGSSSAAVTVASNNIEIDFHSGDAAAEVAFSRQVITTPPDLGFWGKKGGSSWNMGGCSTSEQAAPVALAALLISLWLTLRRRTAS